MKTSAGILLYQIGADGLRVLIVHPGGPIFTHRDHGWWSIPKGEYHDGEDALDAAVRELQEETGAVVDPGGLTALGTVRQRGGKVVAAWCAESDFDAADFVSNTFDLEWPPGSGRYQHIPEVDRAEWCGPAEARERLNSAQAEFVDRLEALLAEQGRLR